MFDLFPNFFPTSLSSSSFSVFTHYSNFSLFCVIGYRGTDEGSSRYYVFVVFTSTGVIFVRTDVSQLDAARNFAKHFTRSSPKNTPNRLSVTRRSEESWALRVYLSESTGVYVSLRVYFLCAIPFHPDNFARGSPLTLSCYMHASKRKSCCYVVETDLQLLLITFSPPHVFALNLSVYLR